MIFYLLMVSLGLAAFGVAAWKAFYPDYVKSREEREKEQQLQDLIERVERHGTPQQKAALAKWRERQISIELKQLETKQALEMIRTRDVYDLLVAGDVDVAALERALAPGRSDLSSPLAEDSTIDTDLAMLDDPSRQSS